VPIAMRRFYEQTLCILHKFLLANQDLHHGLLAVDKVADKLRGEAVHSLAATHGA
jgi:hypothetical protein